MVNLSKRPIDKRTLLKINILLYEVLVKRINRDIFFQTMNDLISQPEQLMIAKRISIIYLLMKGLEQTTIAQYLKVSRATVAKFSLLFYEKESQFIIVLRSILRKEKLTQTVENILADFLIQPGIKKGHWDLYWQQQKRKKDQQMIDV